jgi:hypothetical protein
MLLSRGGCFDDALPRAYLQAEEYSWLLVGSTRGFRLQLHQNLHDAPRHARDGGWRHKPLFGVSDLVNLLIASESEKAA